MHSLQNHCGVCVSSLETSDQRPKVHGPEHNRITLHTYTHIIMQQTGNQWMQQTGLIHDKLLHITWTSDGGACCLIIGHTDCTDKGHITPSLPHSHCDVSCASFSSSLLPPPPPSPPPALLALLSPHSHCCQWI